MSNLRDDFEDERSFLWGLLYRLTGSAADADDLVQDTFERALTKGPQADDRPLRPWLARVATNLGIDALRRRQKVEYIGPWLPEPTTSDLEQATSPEARYAARESAAFAFLKALEILTPHQRAVLVLRDAFDYSTRETALATGLSESNVKTTLHRARAAMEPYDSHRPSVDPTEVGQALHSLMAALLAGDADEVAKLLAEDVVFTSDANGEYTAARRPVVGAEKVQRFLLALAAGLTEAPQILPVTANGAPALYVEFEHEKPNTATRVLYRIDVRHGLIVALDVVMAQAKLRPEVFTD